MSDSETEMETSGTVDWQGIRDFPVWESLNLPSLGLFILFELLQFVFIIFFFAALSLMPELYELPVNQFFWTKVIVEIILHIMSWVFIYINTTVFYEGLWSGAPKDIKRGKGFWVGGTGTIGFIIYVLLSILSVGYSIMYLIWGGYDTYYLSPGYLKTWMIVLLIIVAFETVGIVLETISIGYYLRRMVFWYGWSNEFVAASRAQFLGNVAGDDTAMKYLNTCSKITIRNLNNLVGGSNTPLETRGLWKKSNVKFKDTGTFVA